MNVSFRLGSSSEKLELSKDIFPFFDNAFLPERAFIPIGYKDEDEPSLLVSNASRVQEGELIGRGKASSPFSLIHASIPGKVQGIREFEIMPGKILNTLDIFLDGSFDILGKAKKEYDWESDDVNTILNKIENAGIADTAGRIVRPLSTYLKKAIHKNITEISTTLFDFYPSQFLDVFLGKEHIKKVIEGARILSHVLNDVAIKIFHNIKDKRLLARYKEEVASICGNLQCHFQKIKNVYPVHLQLHPSTFFVDASTACYVYEAVVNNIPLTSIYVSLQGELLAKPKIFRVKIGTPIVNLIRECGSLKATPNGAIINGITSGYAIKDLNIPITREMKSVHVVGKKCLHLSEEMDCIGCARCFNVCPCDIDPIAVVRAIKRGAITEEVSSSIKRCSGCACCSIVCPARNKLARMITSYKDQFYNED